MHPSCKILAFLVLSLLPVYTSGSFSSSKCLWTDEHSNEYDISHLKKTDFWKVKDGNGDSGLFAMDYLFNFCNTVSQKCKNTYVGALEALEVLGQLTETCEILGKNEEKDQIINQIDSNKPDLGIKISYHNGDICTGSENSLENGLTRKSTFVIYCSESQDTSFVQSKINSKDVTKCSLEFSIKSPAGCRVGYGSGMRKSSIILLWLVVCFIIYAVAGYLYNNKVKGKNGIEAFPNLEFWKELPGLVKEGLKFSFEKLSLGVESAKAKLNNKGAGGGSGYSVV